MKREQATREYLNLSKNDSLVAAVDAYEWVESHPEEAPFMLRSLLFDLHTADVERNQELVSKAVSAFISKRVDEVKSVITKAAISKAANGEDIHSYEVLNEAVELISKKNDKDSYKRDKFGRFSHQETRVHTSGKNPPIPDERKLGIPHAGLSSKKRSRYQQAYLQVGELLRSTDLAPDALIYSVDSEGKQSDIMTISQARAQHANIVDPNNGLVNADSFKKSTDLTVYTIDTNSGRDHTPTTMGYDLLGSTRAGQVFGAATKGQAFDNYTKKLISDRPEPGTNEAFYGRVEAGSKLISTLGDPYLGDKTKAALGAAELAGKHAPEAEKVLGPKARKSAYRYRGVEKTPHVRLQEHINEQRTLQRKKAVEAGYSSAQADTIARQFIIDGEPDKIIPRREGDPSSGVQSVRGQESPVISYFKDRLPDKDLYELNRQSGTIPPSQGIIIDRKGKVVTEAMGYGDDWYLPFNLKNLSKLQGGEYVRTRAYGGVTPEDIYTGLVGGARSVTVVSHSGVYTVEFDDDFRGTRRYSDKSARMINRYEHLLDSLSSGRVTTAQTTPARAQEINDMAALEADPAEDKPGFKEAVARLKRQEEYDPQLAEADIENIKREAADKAAIKAGYNNSSAYAEERMLTLRDEAEKAIRRNPAAKDVVMANTDRQLTSLSTADGLLASLNVDAESLIERKREEYRMAHRPLSLNAKGYEKAQNALKEQFPYYFSDVKYRPWSDSETTGADSGYVKPKFNRPANIASGYWDPNIEGYEAKQGRYKGTGKYKGDRTGYQNYAAVQRLYGKGNEVTGETKTDTSEGEDGASGSSRRKDMPSGMTQEEQKKEAYLAAAIELQRMADNDTFDFTNEDGIVNENTLFYNGRANGVPMAQVIAHYQDPQSSQAPAPAGFKEALSFFNIKNPDVLENALDNPAQSKKLMGQIDYLVNSGLFKVRKDIVEDMAAAKQGNLGKPKEISKDQDKAVKEFFKPNNVNAKWDFPNTAASPEGEMKKAAKTIEAVRHYDETDDLKAVDAAINKASKEYRKKSVALAGMPYAQKAREAMGQKSYAVNPSGTPMFNRDATVNKAFYSQVEGLFRARQAIKNDRLSRSLSEDLADEGPEDNGPFGLSLNKPKDPPDEGPAATPEEGPKPTKPDPTPNPQASSDKKILEGIAAASGWRVNGEDAKLKPMKYGHQR